MRRLITRECLIVLLSAMVLCMVPSLAMAAGVPIGGTFTVDGLTYKVLTPTTVQVGDGTVSMSSVTGDLVIPSAVENDGSLFGVTAIGESAFAGSGLTSVQIPQGVTEIDGGWGTGAFQYCGNLTSVSIPDSVTSIGERAFMQCAKLTSVVIPDGVTEIQPGTFYGCTSLNSVSIGSGATAIVDARYGYPATPWGAFEGCTSLTHVTIPGGVVSIGVAAFKDCTGLTTATIEHGVRTIGGTGSYNGHGWDPRGAFGGCTKLTTVTIPDSVATIGNCAFYNCGLTSLTIPDSVTTIGDSAFVMCNALTGGVAIPGSVASIGNCPFFGCSGITALDVDAGNEHFSSAQGVLFDKTKSVLIECPVGKTGSYPISSSVKTIGDYAFYSSGLSGVTIPDGVNSIGLSAFQNSGLTGVTIPGSVANISQGAFCQCYNLTNVVIRPGVLTIGPGAFMGSPVTSVVLPQTLERLGSGAFGQSLGVGGWNAMKTAQFNSSTTVIEPSAWWWGDPATIPQQATIRGYDPSTAKDYAATYGNAFELIDPVPAVPGNDSTQKPVLVLIAGLWSNTGDYNPPTTNARTLGVPWDYLGDNGDNGPKTSLGVSKILVVPTHNGSTIDGKPIASTVIDSGGALNRNMDALIRWLRQEEALGEFDHRKIILAGHSYGGVIARCVLAAGKGRGFGPGDPLRDKIKCLIQFGSPNGGSGAADFANTYRGAAGPIGMFGGATQALATSTMQQWNRDHPDPVGVPVVRFAGTYLPDALKYMPLGEVATKASLNNSYHHGQPSDGMVAAESVRDGFDSLLDLTRDFGGGAYVECSDLTHNPDLPGTNRSYGDVTYRALVPQPDQGSWAELFVPLVRAIANPSASADELRGISSGNPNTATAIEKWSAGSGTTAEEALSASDLRASGQLAAAPEASPSTVLPQRTVAVTADGSGHLTLPLDAPTNVLISSGDGAPTVTIRDGDGNLIESPNYSDVGADGVATTLLRIEPASPGDFTFDISLTPGASGDVSLSGIADGGAQLTLSAGESPCAGAPTALTAHFESASGDPLLGATVSGTAELTGGSDVALTFRDDGAGGDTVADDGISTAEFTPPVPGRWLLRVDALHASAERAGTLVVDVGAEIATVTGPLTEVTPAGPGSTLASFGVGVPLHVSQEGTYTVSGTLTDGAGKAVGMVQASSSLSADESTTLVASIDASELSGISSGPLTVGPLRITRDTDGIDVNAGSGPGLTSSRSYSASDFYAFSATLSGPAANPSPSHAVHFSGTARNTASTVASVEYTIDGGSTWQAATPTDGAFDSHAEAFTIDLDLPDYVYGILVRQTGADGTQLPVADWAGTRFTVDTTAPAQVADLAALVTTDAGSPVAHATWLASEAPSDTTSPVRYVIALDSAELGSTFDTSFDVSQPSEGSHTLTVTPVDEAGNQGPSQATTFLIDTTPPTTATSGADSDWHNAAVPVTLVPTDNVGGSGMNGGSAKTEYKLGAGDWTPGTSVTVPAPANHSGDGEHTLLYRSTDAAGNTEVARSAAVRIDTTPPSGSFVLAGGATTTPTIAVVGTSTVDDAHGPLQMRFSCDGKASWSDWAAYAATAPLTLPSGSGSKTVYAQYRDAAGNVVELSDTVELIEPPTDTTAPATVATGADDAWHNQAVTVALVAMDNVGGSGMIGGLAKTEYKLDSGDWTTGTGVIVPAPADHSGDGEHTLLYHSTDAAGNVEATKSCTVKIDTISPAGGFALNAGAATTTTPSVTIQSAVSDANGVSRMRFSTDGKATWTSWTTYGATSALVLPAGNGAKTVWGQYEDPACNVFESSANIILAVPTPPAVTLKLSGLKSGALKLGKSVTAKGAVTPPSLAGSKVTLTVQLKKGTKWVKAKTAAALITATGAYSWKYKPAKKGAYRVRSAITKTAAHAAATTKWLAFKVK